MSHFTSEPQAFPSTGNFSSPSFRPECSFSGQNSLEQGDAGGFQKRRRGNKKSASLDVFQDSGNFKFDSLSKNHQIRVRTLVRKFGDQMKYFSFTGTPPSRVRLTCNLCYNTLNIKRVAHHVLVPRHVQKLTKKRQVERSKNSSSAKASFSNDKVGRGVEHGGQGKSTAPPIRARNSVELYDAVFDVWSLSEPNSKSYKYTAAEKDIIDRLKKDSTLQYFDFMYSVELGKSYFRCNPCDVHISPASVFDHVQIEHHLTNLTISSSFEAFLFQKKSCKNITRRLHRTVGEELLRDFSLLRDSISRKPKFKCKICEVTLLSDLVVDHLQSDQHQQKLLKQEITPNINPVSGSGGIRSSPVSSNLSTHKLNFEPTRNSIERVPRGISSEAAVRSAERCRVFKRITADSETTQDERVIRSDDFNDSNYERVIGIENKSNNVQILSCLVCNEHVSSKDLQNHVNSKVHVTRLRIEPSPYDYYADAYRRDDFLRDYYREVVRFFTDFTNYERNCLHIFYGLPQKKLYFYCKFCNLILSAESLELHVNSVHSNDLSGQSQNRTCKIGNSNEVNYFSFATGILSQLSIKFLCEPCNNQVYFKDIARHVDSRKHSESLEIVNNFLKFNSFIAYKDRLLETLALAKQKRTSDFELFSEIDSTKLLIYCKSCELLLRPEYLNEHIDVEVSTLHAHNSMMKWDRDYNSTPSSRGERISNSVARS